MTSKAFRVSLFPILSLALGLAGIGLMLLVGERSIPFLERLLGPPHADSSSFPVYGIPTLLAGIFGFLRPKPKEIWSYGFLMWVPQATVGAALAISRGWMAGFGLVIIAASCLAAVVGVLASYAGFALRKIVNRIRADPEEPPHII
jgi:xanthosine utilization system XapX-like protein